MLCLQLKDNLCSIGPTASDIAQAQFNQAQQRVAFTDPIDEPATTFKLSDKNETIRIIRVFCECCTRNWPLSCQNVHYKNAKREDVYLGGIFGSVQHCLGGHEGRGAWYPCLRHLCGTAGAHVQDLGHAEVRDLGGHAGRQEDVVGGQVAVDDGRRELVEVAQPEGHLQQDGAANLGWEGTVCVQTAAEGGGQVLHHQLRQLGACLHTHAQELDYVRVVELPKQLTLCSKSEK